jgi:Integrase core domain
MDLDDAGSRARFLIRDRDGKFPGLFNSVLQDAGIKVVLSGVQTPRMNSIMERWVLTCRRELLDWTLVWNQAHLLHALREFEQFYNADRPHQGIGNARPLCALPPPIPEVAAATLWGADYSSVLVRAVDEIAGTHGVLADPNRWYPSILRHSGTRKALTHPGDRT